MSEFTRYEAVHADPKGPRDQRTTALQIIQDNDLAGKWSNKVVLITGCSSGIGIETARALKETGAKVYATARNLDKARTQLGDILEPGRVELLELKLDSLTSVRACAEEFQNRENKLNVLINNAGVMALQERQVTEDGFEMQFATNHLGHFLLFQLLKPQLMAGSSSEFQSRVVNVSSHGHRMAPMAVDDLNLEAPGKYNPWAGYANSKTANIYMANEIERRFGSKGIHSHSLHPGGIETGLGVHQVEMLSQLAQDPRMQKVMKSPEQGAATTVWAAVDKVWEGRGGEYLDDCQISKPFNPDDWMGAPGHASWIHDAEAERKLWEASCEMVGVSKKD